MAAVTDMRGIKLLIKVEDVNSPSAYTAYCTINAARGISFSSAVNEFNIPDCADPDLLAWVAREKVNVSCSITGAGMLNTPDTEAFFDWAKDSDTRNVRVYLDGVSTADGGGYWAGAFHCTEFAVTGDRGTRAEASITLVSDGEVTWNDA
jgi:hypothetical protein